MGLLNHSYKIFATFILLRIMPFINPEISDMQSGFRKGRGCRDNILMLVLAIQQLLDEAKDESGIFTYIDFTAAFDSISHSYLLNALTQYNVPLKYCRLIHEIYNSAKVRVRLQEPGGTRSYSRNVDVNRGVIQGDIPSLFGSAGQATERSRWVRGWWYPSQRLNPFLQHGICRRCCATR